MYEICDHAHARELSDSCLVVGRRLLLLAESVRVLDFYSARCTYTLDRVKERGVNTNIKRWLTTVPVSGKYIVHTARHAVFVHVPAVRGRWKLYDQTGVHSQRGFQATGSRGGIMFQKVVAVFTVVDCQ